MSKQNSEEWARYLEKDGEVRLFGVDQLDDARKDGWVEPKGVRGNGLPWNEDGEDGEPAAESAAKLQAEREKRDAKKAEKRAAAQAEANEATESARRDAEQAPDLKVEVVEPKKGTKKSK